MSILFIVTLVRLLPCLCLVIFLFKTKHRFSPLKTSLLTASFALLVAFGVIFMYSPYNPIHNWRVYFAIACVCMGLGFYTLIIKNSFWQILFTVFIVESYSDDIALLGRILENYFPDLLTQNDPLDYLLIQTIISILSFPFIWLFIMKLLQPIIETTKELAFWRYLWIIPVLFYIIYRLCIYRAYLVPIVGLESGIIVALCIWASVTFLSYYVILKMLTETAENGKLHEKLQISTIQLAMQEEQYEQLQSSIEQTRLARHDLRHHLLALYNYNQHHDCLSIQNYLNNLLENLQIADGAPLCENRALNSIIQYYTNLAKQNAIEVKLELNIPEKLPIPEIDLCIAIGNLLENSLESCQRQTKNKKFIHAKATMHTKNTFAITIKNSFNHPIRETNNVFISSKRNSEGIGTASIRNIADKYNGIAKFSYDSNVFQVSLLLTNTMQQTKDE